MNQKLGYELFYSKQMSTPLIHKEKYCPDRDDFHLYMTSCYAKKSILYQNLPFCWSEHGMIYLDTNKITGGKLPLYYHEKVSEKLVKTFF